MCGIAGFVGTSPVAATVRAAMLDALRPRGPDAQRVVAWSGSERIVDASAEADVARPATVALLHARLAIIDPRPEADQPMACGFDAGTVGADDLWLCYNGEVYGWAEEAARLAAAGGPFRTRSDTEFILRGYAAWGIEGLLPRLRGMFAFALLDWKRGRLVLARDRMGKKPLVIARREGDAAGLAFGSTVRSVLPWLSPEARRLSGDALDAYLAHRYVPAPMTIVEGVERLENAHVASVDLSTGRLERTRYWSLAGDVGAADAAAAAGSQGGKDPDEAASALAELDRAIELRTVADRPLGVFLSGGIDSTAVACRLAALGHRDLRTFTAAFDDPRFDESGEAAATAAALGLPNLALPVPARIGDAFERIVADLDEPFADPSVFPTWFLARATREHVVVVLGGDGGDELLAGYKRYAKHLRTAWRRGLALPALPPVLRGASLSAKGATRWADEIALSWREAYVLRFSGFSPAQRRFLQGGRPLSRATWWRMPDADAVAAAASADAPRGLADLLAIDLANYLPEYVLRKADLCTMAHGLELRAPMLDHRFAQRVAALPSALRFTDPPKRLLAPALAPVARLDPFGRKKRGFNPPLQDWLATDLAPRLDRLGARLAAATAGRLDAPAVDAVAGAWRSGQAALAEPLLQLLMLDASLAQLGDLGVTA